MVDGHEHTEQKKHQKYFTTEITIDESRFHRRVHMSVEEFEFLPKRSNILNKGSYIRALMGWQ